MKFIINKNRKILNSYIAHEFLLSFLVSFLFYFFIFFLNQILLMAQGILSKGIPLGSVLRLLLYSMPSFLTFSTPFASLMATLMTYGRLSSDNEILAMRSAGIHSFSIFKPVFFFGILITIFSFNVNNFIQPIALRSFQKLWLELTLTYPGFELEPYSIRNFRQIVLITGDIDQTGIHPMLIIETGNSANRRIIIAKLAAPNNAKKNKEHFPSFLLKNVFSLIPEERVQEEWTWNRAESMDYRLITRAGSSINQQNNPASMQTKDMRKIIATKQITYNKRLEVYQENFHTKMYELSLYYADFAHGISEERQTMFPYIANYTDQINKIRNAKPIDRSLQIWKLEYYQKYAIPLSCLPFIILAYPLGLLARHNGRIVGFFISLLLSAFYWGLLVLGRSLGLRVTISPFMVMLVPDLLLFILALIFFMFRKRI